MIIPPEENLNDSSEFHSNLLLNNRISRDPFHFELLIYISNQIQNLILNLRQIREKYHLEENNNFPSLNYRTELLLMNSKFPILQKSVNLPLDSDVLENILDTESLIKELPIKGLEILNLVYNLGLKGRGPSHNELCRKLNMTKPTLIQRLRVLFRLGLMKETKYGREKNLDVTNRGKKLIGK